MEFMENKVFQDNFSMEILKKSSRPIKHLATKGMLSLHQSTRQYRCKDYEYLTLIEVEICARQVATTLKTESLPQDSKTHGTRLVHTKHHIQRQPKL